MENNSLRLLRDKYNCPKLDELSDEYPVQVGKICSHLGIEASYQFMSKEASGRIFVLDNTYFVEANAQDIPARRRFTIAHELGHYCLHKEFLDSVGTIFERTVSRSMILD